MRATPGGLVAFPQPSGVGGGGVSQLDGGGGVDDAGATLRPHVVRQRIRTGVRLRTRQLEDDARLRREYEERIAMATRRTHGVEAVLYRRDDTNIALAPHNMDLDSDAYASGFEGEDAPIRPGGGVTLRLTEEDRARGCLLDALHGGLNATAARCEARCQGPHELSVGGQTRISVSDEEAADSDGGYRHRSCSRGPADPGVVGIEQR